MLKEEKRGSVVILRLDRPEKLNAWNFELRDLLRATLDRLDGDDNVAAVVLTGTGARAFCAGADLSDKGFGEAAAAGDRMTAFRAFYRAVQSFRKPLVTALNGMALGSAFQVVLLTDYRVAHAGVEVGLPEVRSGIPCISGSAIVTWSAGVQLAARLALSGRSIKSEEAMAHGLIDEIVAPEEVLDRAVAVAAELAELPKEGYAETKLWLRDLTQGLLDTAFDRAAEIRSKSSMEKTIKGGVGSFLRKP